MAFKLITLKIIIFILKYKEEERKKKEREPKKREVIRLKTIIFLIISFTPTITEAKLVKVIILIIVTVTLVIIIMMMTEMSSIRMTTDTNLFVTLGASNDRHEEVLYGGVRVLQETLALALGAVAVMRFMALPGTMVGGDDVHVLLR